MDDAPPPTAAAAFRASRPRNLNGDIADFLGRGIVEGTYATGAAIPGEIAFCAEAGVSRSAYREAIRMLAGKGLIESRPRIGTRVTPRETWNLLDPDVVRWFFTGPSADPAFVEDLFELRRMVEPQAAARAATRAGDGDISDLRTALEGMALHAVGSEPWRSHDKAFHSALLRATGNAVLASLASGICAAVSWTTDYKYRNLDNPRDPLDDHAAVFDAIAVRQAARAHAAMEALLDNALRDTSQAAPEV